MVRTKVDLKYVQNVQKRRVCFSKRRAGLLKKARELSVLCDAEIGVVVYSSTGRLYEYASTSMPQIIRRYITTTGAWPETARVVVQQAEENRALQERILRLESENMALRKDFADVVSDNQRLLYGNSNVETTLALTL
ncbi:MADS-box protein AGL71-like [Bidens hawaiensis]|uniref:MADS-box protein AGL71-like n=1 Tax=Bidens hawaiensis TaxID=980011 RepID=UPI00404B1ECA